MGAGDVLSTGAIAGFDVSEELGLGDFFRVEEDIHPFAEGAASEKSGGVKDSFFTAHGGCSDIISPHGEGGAAEGPFFKGDSGGR